MATQLFRWREEILIYSVDTIMTAVNFLFGRYILSSQMWSHQLHITYFPSVE